jgi:hypothetical protein
MELYVQTKVIKAYLGKTSEDRDIPKRDFELAKRRLNAHIAVCEELGDFREYTFKGNLTRTYAIGNFRIHRIGDKVNGVTSSPNHKRVTPEYKKLLGDKCLEMGMSRRGKSFLDEL